MGFGAIKVRVAAYVFPFDYDIVSLFRFAMIILLSVRNIHRIADCEIIWGQQNWNKLP